MAVAYGAKTYATLNDTRAPIKRIETPSRVCLYGALLDDATLPVAPTCCPRTCLMASKLFLVQSGHVHAVD
jgi:hypothetical protein